MNLTPYIVTWSLLAVAVLGLALYRKIVSMREEDGYVHISEGEENKIPSQIAAARKLDVVDRWGKTLTVVTVAAGLVLAAVYFNEKL